MIVNELKKILESFPGEMPVYAHCEPEWGIGIGDFVVEQKTLSRITPETYGSSHADPPVKIVCIRWVEQNDSSAPISNRSD